MKEGLLIRDFQALHTEVQIRMNLMGSFTRMWTKISSGKSGAEFDFFDMGIEEEDDL